MDYQQTVSPTFDIFGYVSSIFKEVRCNFKLCTKTFSFSLSYTGCFTVDGILLFIFIHYYFIWFTFCIMYELICSQFWSVTNGYIFGVFVLNIRIFFTYSFWWIPFNFQLRSIDNEIILNSCKLPSVHWLWIRIFYFSYVLSITFLIRNKSFWSCWGHSCQESV